uniref:Papilin n=1 Tax=Trichobilharzia regenti TaxID=157069 RepID=A0AA85K1P8_TRIRE|nr:unnamed protein product [Trichobilharzia regenti]
MLNKKLILSIHVVIILLNYSSIITTTVNATEDSEDVNTLSLKEEEFTNETHIETSNSTDLVDSSAHEETNLESNDTNQAANAKENSEDNQIEGETQNVTLSTLGDDEDGVFVITERIDLDKNPSISSSGDEKDEYSSSEASSEQIFTYPSTEITTTLNIENLSENNNNTSDKSIIPELNDQPAQALSSKAEVSENIMESLADMNDGTNDTVYGQQSELKKLMNETEVKSNTTEEFTSSSFESENSITEIPIESTLPNSVIMEKIHESETTTTTTAATTTISQDTSILQVASSLTNIQPVEPTNEKSVLKEKCYQYPKIKACGQLGVDMKSRGGWYFNPTEMQCQYTSDCIVNDNVFKTKEECSETCEYWRGTARCLAPPQAGHFRCSAVNTERTVRPILMVYFDKVSGKCRWFTYYGCGGSANRFTSIIECENTCGSLVAYKILLVANQLCQVAPTTRLFPQWSRIDIDTWSLINQEDQFYTKETSEPILFDNLTYIDAMRIEPECANMGQQESRWYLDVETNQCQEFAYSHCGGSSNNFLTRADCEQFCGAAKPDALTICKLNPSPGECTDYKTMWYYDPNWLTSVDGQDHQMIGVCRQFNYSGCGGNSNRFPTQASCEMMCQFNTKIELQIDMDSSEEASNVTGQNDLHDDEDVYSDPPSVSTTETNKTTQSNLNRKTTKLTLMNIDLEPCRRHPVFGFCRPLNCSEEQKRNQTCQFLNFQRWFFNAHTSNCEAYSYSGCGASENSFDDAQACQAACKARIVRPDRDQRCDSNPHSKKCYKLSVSGNQQDESTESNVIAFHFSIVSATCKAFHLNTQRSGCSMEHYFPNGYDCLRACVKSSPTEKHLQNRCFARKTHMSWNCTDHSTKAYRWSYLPEINQCVRFSECTDPDQNMEQPGNNFASRSECETTCMATSFEEVCQLPKDPGPCTSFQTRYFYDSSASKCRVFLYGGCLGNFNRFLSRKECELACSQYSTHLLSTNNQTKSSETLQEEKLLNHDEPPLLSAQVFEKMKQTTRHHTDRYPWDICLDSHSYGTCSLSGGQYQTTSEYPYVPLTRYYYDRRLGQCQPYTYTGCGARGNHFDTLGSCQKVCENRLRNPKFARCHFNQSIKRCPGSGIQAWAYNHSIGDCYYFEITSQWLGVWQARTGSLPEGIYATRSACQYHCLPKPPKGTDTQNVCHMNPIVTVPYGCNAMVTRWYFEPRETQCRSYITCPQYGNNFPSHKACQDVCTPGHPIDVCRLPHDHGGCSNFEKRWYYDMDKRMCMPFTYGGCFGNSNRFLTKAECEGFCMGKDICRLPLQKNSTDPSYPERFYYDQSKKQCLPFRFTGLLAHGNNFPSLSICNATCIYVPDIEVIAEKNVANYNLTLDKAIDKTSKTLGKESQLKDSIVIEKPTENDDGNSVHIKTSDTDNDSTKFPCLPFLTDSQYDEMTKQTYCNPEDIIHELGYRFQVTTSIGETNEVIDGICVPVLVPICLNEPKSVYGQFNVFESQMIGRVFKTEAQCEATCLLRSRFKRSIQEVESQNLPRNVHQLIADILKKKKILTGLFNATTDSSLKYESKILEHHDGMFQAYTVSLNQSNMMKKPLMIEKMENEQVNLPCRILSLNKPTVQWTHLLSRKRYSVEVHQHPSHENIWISDLFLTAVKANLHTGGWICEAFHPETEEYTHSQLILHVISTQKGENLLSTAMPQTTLNIPENGLILLRCPSAPYSNHVMWKKADISNSDRQVNKYITQASSEYLIIENANSKLHSGLWICGIQNNDKFIELYEFNLIIGYPPELLKGEFNALGSASQHSLTCSPVSEGLPKGSVEWFQCERMNKCNSTESQTITLDSSMPLNGTTFFICRIENMWGRDESYFRFNV